MKQDKKHKNSNWVKEHKEEVIVVTGIGIASILAIIMGTKNKDELLKLFNNAKNKIDDFTTPLYGSKWLTKATEEELKSVRQMMNTEYGKWGDNLAFSIRNQIDKELNKRAWGDVIPHGPSYSREHGYNLYRPD